MTNEDLGNASCMVGFAVPKRIVTIMFVLQKTTPSQYPSPMPRPRIQYATGGTDGDQTHSVQHGHQTGSY